MLLQLDDSTEMIIVNTNVILKSLSTMYTFLLQ